MFSHTTAVVILASILSVSANVGFPNHLDCEYAATKVPAIYKGVSKNHDDEISSVELKKIWQ